MGLALSTLLAVSVAFGWVLEKTMAPAIDRWAQEQMTLLASHAVAEAANQVAQSAGMHLVSYRMGGPDQVVGIEYNWLAIGRIVARTSQALERLLRDLASQDVSVPLGEVTGLRVLGGRGPQLRVRLMSAGSFVVQPFSEFREAGYNQTLHRIGLGVSVRVAVVAPFIGETVHVRADIPVVENQIVGRVPSFLVQWGRSDLTPGPHPQAATPAGPAPAPESTRGG